MKWVYFAGARHCCSEESHKPHSHPCHQRRGDGEVAMGSNSPSQSNLTNC